MGSFVCAAAIEHHELNEFFERIETVPFVQVIDVVRPNQPEQFRVRVPFADLQHGIDTVRRRRSLQFAIIGHKIGLPVDCRAQHRQPQFAARLCLLFFERRERGRNENQLVEFEFLAGLPAQDQMAVMNRVERAAIDAYLFQISLLLTLQPRMHTN